MKIDMGKIDVSSSCAIEIKNILKNKSAFAKSCYRKQLRNNHLLKGRVKVLFWIATDGSIEDVILINSTRDKVLSYCLKRKISTWTFPKNCSTQLDFSFVFAP